jgi:tRNA(fMet)-specific endonuclease VapC
MNLYVLDTDTLQLLQDEHPMVAARVRAKEPSELAISVVTVDEQLSGWYTQLRQAKDHERLAWAWFPVCGLKIGRGENSQYWTRH